MSLAPQAKPKLLVLELWGLGDLAIAAPFLQASANKFEVTLVAKPYARDLASRFFPAVRVHSLVAPWTAFHRKYRLVSWPWKELFQLSSLAGQSFDIGVSGRWDPRDHLLLCLLGFNQRMGFPRLGSQVFLTDPLPRPARYAHRYEYWRALGKALGLDLPRREQVGLHRKNRGEFVLVHTGAAQKVRVWPLERYRALVTKLRLTEYEVRVFCDPDQEAWWRANGETEVVVPKSVGELAACLEKAWAFLGNDSGPGHLAAFSGVPTFTLFGPQLSEWFAPLHPAAEWLDGSPCLYKPCFDQCRFASPKCLEGLDQATVIGRVQRFLAKLYT
jgi:ADP-heptose:LPS heptosyltransferase